MTTRKLLLRLLGKVNWLFRRLGVILVRYPLAPDRRRSTLFSRYGISAVIDIGANAGQYGTRLRQQGYRGRIFSYEPLPDAYAQLLASSRGDPLWSAENSAVGATTGTVTLHVANNSESSSILPMLQRHIDAAPDSRQTGTVSVNATTLDAILSTPPAQAVMIKIDTQGYERQILEGGRTSLASAALVEVELSLVPLYAEQALFRQIDAMLLAAGFSLISLEEGFFDEATGELLQIDAIYANSSIVPTQGSRPRRT